MRMERNGSRSLPLYVMVSLDVEEEGLFSGLYRSSGLGVKNVALLPRLAPISRDLNFPLTLFCSHAVFSDPAACANLAWMRHELGSEIGAHLHHWSTPPFPAAPAVIRKEPERTHRLPRGLFEKRLDNLLGLGRKAAGSAIVSFRMGRWDLKGVLRPLLRDRGILVDSSVCPLRCFAGGADHFLAPADPYWAPETPDLLEAPITQVPLAKSMARAWYKLNSTRAKLLDKFHFFGALSPNPIWHSQMIMRLATRLHWRRGGRVLSLFWHSSEMLPEASPAVGCWQELDALLAKIQSFLAWLKKHYPVRGVTAAQLYDLARSGLLGLAPQANYGDW